MAADRQASLYDRGPTDARKTHPRLETKPTVHYSDGRVDTGGGYERIRSTEWRPETSRREKEDVYVAHHRLLAVAACYPADMTLADVLEHLDGRDVHHTSGVEWDNRPDTLEVVDHGTHSQITQAQMRAWAADAKRDLNQREGDGDQSVLVNDGPRCGNCDTADGVLVRCVDFEGVRCHECLPPAEAVDAPLEVVE